MANNENNSFTKKMLEAKNKKKMNKVQNLGEFYKPKSIAVDPKPPEPNIDIVEISLVFFIF